ncbi:hypothetical protein ACTWQF_34220 [Streptomyces sp. 8N114]|uniref:hypothetical protein n=1 Tax=Streptomyces sp. 8N114 TaxID=3457419 RepID=UPI003FD5383E
MATFGELTTSRWHRLAQPTERHRALWARGSDSTRWAECGRTWDAVAITPISRGLDALGAMRLNPTAGFPVLADRLRDVLYILVPPRTGSAAAGLPGVRILSLGDQLLLPQTPHGTEAAYWISTPRHFRLVRTDRLSVHLRALADRAGEEAATP